MQQVIREEKQMLDKAVLAILPGEEKKSASDARSVLDYVAKALGGKQKNDTTTKSRIRDEGAGLKTYEVQFNPSSMRYQGQGGTRLAGEEAGKLKQEQYSQAAEISLSVELICEGSHTREQVSGLLGLKVVHADRAVMFCWRHGFLSA